MFRINAWEKVGKTNALPVMRNLNNFFSAIKINADRINLFYETHKGDVMHHIIRFLVFIYFLVIFSNYTSADESNSDAVSPLDISLLEYQSNSNLNATNRLIVKFSNNASLLKYSQSFNEGVYTNASGENTDTLRKDVVHLMGREMGHSMKVFRAMSGGSHVIELNQGEMALEDLKILMRQMMKDKVFVSVEPDLKMEALAIPNDSRYNEQWHYFESTGGLNLPDAWDIASGDGIVVSVIDTGITAHTDLDGNVIGGYDFISDVTTAHDGNGRDNDPSDPGDWTRDNECEPGRRGRNSSWHGTHVAGTIAAVTNNQSGVAGVAPEAKLIIARVLGRCGGFLSDIADAIRWSAGVSVPGVPSNPNPADVINMSLGGGGACTSTYQSAINAAVNAGTTVVVAAGNSNANASNFSPASCNNVISVAATSRQGSKASYSNFGSVVDVAAPGGDTRRVDAVLSTINSGSRNPGSQSYAFNQGTSMAAPHVAGAVALMKSIDDSLSPSNIENILEETSRAFPARCNQCGSGIVDAHAALLRVQGVEPPTPTPPPTSQDDFFENSDNLDIPDGAGRGVAGPTAVSVIPVSRTGDAGTITVSVDIRHTYISDLVVVIRAPNGASATLHDREGGSSNNIITSYTLNASGIEASGEWRLEIQDFWNQDAGSLNSWSIEF